MKPTRSILDPQFRYRSAANTDVSLTFRRARLKAKLDAEEKRRNTEQLDRIVTQMRRK